MGKKDSFARYEGEEIELVGFSHSGGDLTKKLETLRKKGVDVVHISTCTKSKTKITKLLPMLVLNILT